MRSCLKISPNLSKKEERGSKKIFNSTMAGNKETKEEAADKDNSLLSDELLEDSLDIDGKLEELPL